MASQSSLTSVSLEHYLTRVQGILLSPKPISIEESQNLCDLAHLSGPATKHLYHQMLTQGVFIARLPQSLACFNFSEEKKKLFCDPEDAKKKIEVAPSILFWQGGAKDVCQEQMNHWQILSNSLDPGHVQQLFLENLEIPTLTTPLLPNVFSMDEVPDKKMKRVYQMLFSILGNEALTLSLKRYYADEIQGQLILYLAEYPNLNTVAMGTYQSAFNTMFNDFTIMTQDFGTIFQGELDSWKPWLFGAIGGILTYYGSYHLWFKAHVRKKTFGAPDSPIPTKGEYKISNTTARGYSFASALLGFVITYVASSALFAAYDRYFEKKELKPCFPPYCPAILLKSPQLSK